MDVVSIFSKITGSKKKIGFYGDKTSLMQMEVVENISHTFSSTITNEKGSLEEVSDNIKNEPVILDMVCRISKNPVSLLSNIQGVAASVLPSNPVLQTLAGIGIKKISNALLNNSKDRPKDFFDNLIEMRDRKTLFDVVTGLETYKNMFFSSISIVESNLTSESLVFSCQLKEVLLKVKGVITTTGTEKKVKTGTKKPKKATTGLADLTDALVKKFTKTFF